MTHARNLSNRSTDFVSVKDYGAVGDGVTDDTAAIQAAFNAVKSTGGRLFLPKGVYYVSSTIGNAPQTTTDWADNVEIVGENGTTLRLAAAYSGTCLSLNGDNVAIRNIAITSARTIDHHANLVTQRTPYQLGIIIGGKIGVGTLATFKNGATVTGCTITNMNEPLTATMAGRVVVSDNVIDEFTDTGVMIQDCTTDIWVERNKITRGGDDCIFVRHYATTPWAVAGNYVGRVKIRSNFLNDTFGKNVGIGGYGDVEISSNYCGLSYAGGINLEKDDWYKTNQANYRNYLIANNEIMLAGRNWSTAEPYALHQSPAPGSNPSGFQMVYGNTSGAVNYQNVTFTGNQIVNPYYSGIVISTCSYLFVSGNTCSPGTYNQGATTPATQNVCWAVDSTTTNALFTNNKTSGELGVTLVNTASIATGSPGPTSGIAFANNFDLFSGEAVTYADGPARSGTTYSVLHYGDQGSATFSAGTTVAVTLTRYQPDTSYRISLGAQANKTFWVSAKTTSGFTLNASALSSDVVDWSLTR